MLLKVSRDDLGIFAASKGLFNGAIHVKQGDGQWVDCRTVGASGLPIRNDGRCEIESAGARYILVVEVLYP